MKKAVYLTLEVALLSLISLSSISTVYIYGHCWQISLLNPSGGSVLSYSPVSLQVGGILSGSSVNFYLNNMFVGSATSSYGITFKSGLTIGAGLASVSVTPTIGTNYWYVKVTYTSPGSSGFITTTSPVYSFSYYPPGYTPYPSYPPPSYPPSYSPPYYPP
jgi:hypothetical protein